MRFRYVIVILLVVGLFGCATTEGKKTEKEPYSYNLITTKEVNTSNAANAHDLIKALRPNWLRGVGVSSFKFNKIAYPIVYMDDVRIGEMVNLASISTVNISKIQHINANESALKLGRGHHGGAILITMK